MHKLIYSALSLLAAGSMYAQSPKDFVGTWSGQNMTRTLELQDHVLVMTETQASGQVVVRKYPTDGSEVIMDGAPFAGAKARGKMEGNVLTVDTAMTTGMSIHDVWTLSADGKTFTNQTTFTGGGRGGARGGGKGGGGAMVFTKQQ
jgi:hypothetical protein